MMLTAAVCLSMLIACATVRVWTSNPNRQTADTPYFTAELEPVIKEGQNYFNAFRLTLKNKTDKALTIDWQKTRYLKNGKQEGHFVFKGVSAKNFNTPPSDTVTAGQSVSKVIYPASLIAIERLRSRNVKIGESGFSAGVIPEGENGILLIIKQDATDIQEQITVKIQVKEVRS